MSTTFQYSKAFAIEYRGCMFHSLTELRYALMIEEEYAFIREGIQIFYNPQTQSSIQNLNEHSRKYIPDFLARNWQTGKAYLVEIKPTGFDDYDQLSMRQKVAEHFIQTHKHDWEYKVVYANDIRLSDEKYKLFKELASHKAAFKKRCQLQQMENRYNQGTPRQIFHKVPYFNNKQWTKEQYAFFVRKGRLPEVLPDE